MDRLSNKLGSLYNYVLCKIAVVFACRWYTFFLAAIELTIIKLYPLLIHSHTPVSVGQSLNQIQKAIS